MVLGGGCAGRQAAGGATVEAAVRHGRWQGVGVAGARGVGSDEVAPADREEAGRRWRSTCDWCPVARIRGPGERSHLDRLDHLAGINDDLSACHPFRNIKLKPQILCWPWHTPVDQRYADGGVVAHCQEPLDDIVLGYLLALEEAELKKALITERNSFWVFGTKNVDRRYLL